VAVTTAVGALLPASGQTPGSNPIIRDVYTADPAPLVVGNTLYLYTGHDESNSSFYTMNNWRCYSSQDMTNWTSYGSILSYTNFTVRWSHKRQVLLVCADAGQRQLRRV
jgi:beta-xylosidase